MEEVVKITLTCWLVCSAVVYPICIDAQDHQDADSSCTQIDFDQATLTSLKKCGYVQEFTAKPYNESSAFDPYRPEATHYLSNRWEGLSCGETVQTYFFNSDTELRMAYSLIFTSGATLEVRVYDLDRLDAAGSPILVESWRRMSSTNGWGFFREKLNKTVKRAQIQIQANMNAASELAVEYLTIFNYEVDSEECSAIDEFQTTTDIPSTTADPSTTTFPATTIASTALTTDTEEITDPMTEVSEEHPTTTPEASTTTTSEATAITSTATTTTSTAAPTTTTEETTTVSPTTTTGETTTVSSTTTTVATTTTTEETTTVSSTTTTAATTTTTAAATTTSSTTAAATTTTSPTTTPSSTTERVTVTTTTNGPRDDTSMLPTSSSTIDKTPTTVQATDSSSQSTPAATKPTTPSAASPPGAVSASEWMWMTLAALFATLFLLAASAVFYLWFVNQHLDRVMHSLLKELSAEKQFEKHCIH